MKMLINSRWVESSNGKTRQITNPATGEVIDTVPQATPEDIHQAVQAAQKGKERMRKLPAHRRCDILMKTALLMEHHREELSRLLAKENGKPIRQTREEISAAIRIFRGFAEEAKRIFGRSLFLDMVPGMERHFAVTVREPLGVAAAIVPFNYPVELYAHKGAAALAAGNAVIVKPPSDCPLTLLKIAEYLEQTGLPQAGHQVVTGPGETIGELLASISGIQLISVTGSTSVGIRISRLASDTLKKVHLELGGNDATIVCADADLEKAADAIILGRLARGNGQICCAVKRVLVDSKVQKEFTGILVEKVKRLKVGDQMLEDTDVGPLINEKAAIQVEKDIQEAIKRGAEVLVGGKRHDNFIDPTVLINVSLNTRVIQQETFGPVVPILTFDSIDEAVQLANESIYGLQAAVFTNDLSSAFDIARKLEGGGVIVNWSSAVRLEKLPFGGIKMSGHGRESIHDTLNEMMEQKTIIIYNAINIFNTS